MSGLTIGVSLNKAYKLQTPYFWGTAPSELGGGCLVVGLAMQERIKALSVLALSGGLDPMDCLRTKKWGTTGETHQGKPRKDAAMWKRGVGGLTADFARGEKLRSSRRKMALQKGRVKGERKIKDVLKWVFTNSRFV